LIDKEGQVLEKELANPENAPKVLAREAMRFNNLYLGGFFSALDTNTHHSTQWAYIPFRFSLGGETSPSGNAEFDYQ
jgi:hypothetical protein